MILGQTPIPPITDEKSFAQTMNMIKRQYHEGLYYDQYFEISNTYDLPLHHVYLMVHAITTRQSLTLADLSSSPYYAICRDILTPYKSKSQIFQRYFNLSYPYLKQTDKRLAWFLKVKNGLTLTQKVALLEGETSFTMIGVGKYTYELAMRRYHLGLSKDDVEHKRLTEFDSEWALAVSSYVTKERGDLTAAEILRTADALQEEKDRKLKIAVIAYLLSRMGKIEVYFLAQQINRSHDQISRTSSLVRAFASVFDIDYKMIERLVSMHSMVDVAQIVEQGGSLLEYQRLQPFRPFRPMLAIKPQKSYTFPCVAEAKYDGNRLLIHKQGLKIQLWSRRRKQYTSKFPQLINLRDVIPAVSVILDGEIVGIRWTVNGPRYANVYELNETISNPTPNFIYRYIIFDVLFLNGMELVNYPYAMRRQIRHQLTESIKSAISQFGSVPGVDVMEVEHYDVSSTAELMQVYEHFIKTNHEGTIIKYPESRYEMGIRSTGWQKLKPRETLDVAITGVVPIRTAHGVVIKAFRYAVKQGEQLVNLGMVDNINRFGGARLAELVLAAGYNPQPVDLTVDTDQSVWTSRSEEKSGYVVEPTIVVTIDSLGKIKKQDRYSIRNAKFLYIREDKEVDEISTVEDLMDYMVNI